MKLDDINETVFNALDTNVQIALIEAASKPNYEEIAMVGLFVLFSFIVLVTM